jgi:hypothetical protein
MPTADEAARVIELKHDFCIAAWQQLYIIIWRHETTMDGVRAADTHLDEFARSIPQGGLLTIIEQGAPMPSSDVRNSLARFLTGGAKFIRSSAVAFEGAGFRAAAVRGVVTGLTMLARQPYPHKVFATMAEAANWLGASLPETAGIHLDSGRLVPALGELRERVNRG